jgi:hypothetical protein
MERAAEGKAIKCEVPRESPPRAIFSVERDNMTTNVLQVYIIVQYNEWAAYDCFFYSEESHSA